MPRHSPRRLQPPGAAPRRAAAHGDRGGTEAILQPIAQGHQFVDLGNDAMLLRERWKRERRTSEILARHTPGPVLRSAGAGRAPSPRSGPASAPAGHRRTVRRRRAHFGAEDAGGRRTAFGAEGQGRYRQRREFGGAGSAGIRRRFVAEDGPRRGPSKGGRRDFGAEVGANAGRSGFFGNEAAGRTGGRRHFAGEGRPPRRPRDSCAGPRHSCASQ